MKLEYGTILCPEPITLSVGTLRSPTLREIGRLSFEQFGYYEFLLKMTPETFYTIIRGDDGKAFWDSLTSEEKRDIALYDIIEEDEKLAEMYAEVFDFFFVEPVVFKEGYFILLKEDIEDKNAVDPDNIRGVIARETLPQVLGLIQQICCIHDDKKEEEEAEEPKFKNELARQLYEKMQKAKKQEVKKKADVNYSLPNIVSAVSNKHPSISPITVWDLTIFQLLDAFNRLQINTVYEIDSTRVSVWGDEKKTFNPSLWYKNEYDNNQAQP